MLREKRDVIVARELQPQTQKSLGGWWSLPRSAGGCAVPMTACSLAAALPIGSTSSHGISGRAAQHVADQDQETPACVPCQRKNRGA